jgi:hypothetical protein
MSNPDDDLEVMLEAQIDNDQDSMGKAGMPGCAPKWSAAATRQLDARVSRGVEFVEFHGLFDRQLHS